MSDTLIGIIASFFREDPKEVIWLFIEDSPEDLTGAHALEDGDRLTVFGRDGDAVFDGLIDCDYGGSELTVKGFRVSWLQRGYDPDAWIGLFMTGKEKPYRAELIKRTLH